MRANQPVRSSLTLSDNPDKAGPSLAQIVQTEGGRQAILGQAWLAAPDRLVTCGHVVDRYVPNPQSLSVFFPSSGNSYPVQQIKLHPSFVRQPDQLVKFDVAVLVVQLHSPEAGAQLLPFSWEHSLKTNQSLSTIRYPVHLGQISAALQPLTQEGRFLGLLRKHDSFHLLHDVPLAPGDSGAPILDGNTVVAVHCGDTATLPGLNLPTTSIRLALWIDALRELGLSETRGGFSRGRRSLLPALGAFIVAAIAGALGACYLTIYPDANKWAITQPSIEPIKLSFNHPVHGYKLNEDIRLVLVPGSDCYLFLFQIDPSDTAAVFYPPYGMNAFLGKGESRTVYQFGHTKLTANPDKADWHLIAIDAKDPNRASQLAAELLTEADWANTDKADRPLSIKGKDLLLRLKRLKEENPQSIFHTVLEGPTSQ